MQPGSADPSAELFEAAWGSLRGLLVAEMKRRGLWTSPPSYLGVIGHRHWVIPGPQTDALDELTARCFEFVFVRRHGSLSERARSQPDIGGLVRLAVRHFLLDSQRRNDPLGFRIFEVLRRTVEVGDEAGRIQVQGTSRRIRNDTLLLVPGTPFDDDQPSADPGELAERWVAEHLDGLVTAARSRLRVLTEELATDLATWMEEGEDRGRALSFGDLASALKSRARAAWASRILDLPAIRPDAETPRLEPPSHEFEQTRRFRRIAACVSRSIQRLEERKKTIRYLERLWTFLRAFAVETPLEKEHEISRLGERDLPSYRELSRLLQIPRERIPGLLERLGDELQRCSEDLDSLPESSTEENAMPEEPASDSPREKALAALRSFKSRASEHGSPPAENGGEILVGDVLSLPVSETEGVFWLVVGADDGGARLRLAPVDSHPLLGPDDVPLREEAEEGEPWILRAGWEITLGKTLVRAALGEGGRRLDRIPPHELPVHHEGRPAESEMAHWRVDEDLPAYRDWIEAGPAAAHRRLASLPLPFHRPAEDESRPSHDAEGRGNWQGWLAAVLALAVLGLGIQWQRLDKEIDRLSRPVVDLPYREIRLSREMRGESRIDVPETSSHVQLGLLLPERVEAEAYRIEMADPAGHLLFRSEPLEPSAEFTLTLPVELLESESFTLRIFVREQATWRLLHDEHVDRIETR